MHHNHITKGLDRIDIARPLSVPFRHAPCGSMYLVMCGQGHVGKRTVGDVLPARHGYFVSAYLGAQVKAVFLFINRKNLIIQRQLIYIQLVRGLK